MDRLCDGSAMRLLLRSLPGPLMVDAEDAVEESREDNNGWSPPFNGTPTLPRTPGPTKPYCLPTVTPSPIPTEALPELRLERLEWRAAGRSPLCLGPLNRLSIAIRNAGGSASGPFEVQAGQHLWFFDSLAPGESRADAAGPVNWVSWPIVIDAREQVPESDEANNLVWPDRSLTATPTGTQAPTCSPTPRVTTPVATTPTAPATVTPVPPPIFERLLLPWARP